MSDGKIIHINPDWFEIQKKTKKNRAEKSKVSIPKPIIPTSTIRRKLLNRIKEKKGQENKINKNKLPKVSSNIYDDDNLEHDYNEEIDENENENDDEDELTNAINYFDSMAEREKEKQKILNKTYKNRNIINNSSLSANNQLNNLQLNIPYQLKQTHSNDNIDNIASTILDDLPYGCLKNGKKPTYKNWMNSIKNYSSMSNTDIVRPPTPPKKRLTENISESEYKESLFLEPDNHKENILKKQINDRLKKIETEQNETSFDDNIEHTSGENVSNKQYIKKIIKKRYTLGKSSKYRKVGVLIKGRQTKKNIINSHKKLKHTDIHQIKKYLKKHGMLKTGSSCPDEILRKMYESAMLSGEINNTNKNTLIHNFLNDDENNK
jgi:hypothetical protein